MNRRGFFGIGIEHTKTHQNVGTLWRTAHLLGASFVFTVGRRYKQQATDTFKTTRHVPCWHFETLDQLRDHCPLGAPFVGIELDPTAEPIGTYEHPQQAVYLLGAEDHGLSNEARRRCHRLIVLPGDRSMNVAVAGSIVMFDRWQKRAGRIERAVAAE